MKNKANYLIALGLIAAFLLGFYAYSKTHKTPQPLSAGLSQRDTFDQITVATTTTVTASGTLVISQLNSASAYWSIVNSGSNGISCYPSATTTGLTYGGGWWLAGSGGAISFDGVALYKGKVSCLTSGSATTTVGVVTR